MKSLFAQIVSLAMVMLLAAGCSSSNEPTAEETAKETQDALNKGLADVKSSVDDATSKMKEEISAQLQEQTKALVAQFTSSNDDLKTQYASIESKISDLKDKLPGEISKVIDEKLPKLEASIAQLEKLVAQFSPKTLEQVESFKTQYSKELKMAQDLVKELMSLVQKADIKLPSL